jgi:hypothetical protein
MSGYYKNYRHIFGSSIGIEYEFEFDTAPPFMKEDYGCDIVLHIHPVGAYYIYTTEVTKNNIHWGNLGITVPYDVKNYIRRIYRLMAFE